MALLIPLGAFRVNLLLWWCWKIVFVTTNLCCTQNSTKNTFLTHKFLELKRRRIHITNCISFSSFSKCIPSPSTIIFSSPLILSITLLSYLYNLICGFLGYPNGSLMEWFPIPFSMLSGWPSNGSSTFGTSFLSQEQESALYLWGDCWHLVGVAHLYLILMDWK